MLDYKTLALRYPNFPMIEPDKGICKYMQEVTKLNIYSAYVEKYCIGMLKYILNSNNDKYKNEYKILLEIYKKISILDKPDKLAYVSTEDTGLESYEEADE